MAGNVAQSTPQAIIRALFEQLQKPSLFSIDLGSVADENFVCICMIDNEEDASRVVEVFSTLFHQNKQAAEQVQRDSVEREARRELREIYEAVAPNDSGEDAYLKDGVWISRDGDWSDRGR